MPNKSGKIRQISSNTGENPAQFMCYVDEFEPDTNEEDGSVLMTVDRSTLVIKAYYMAFDKHWCMM